MPREISTIVSGLTYTECPRWHDGRLWFVDFYTHQVLSVAEDGSDQRLEAEVPEQPSGLGWLPDGRLLVVSMRDARVLRREHDGTLVTHADVSAHTGGHLNDMVVDARGRAYAGNFGFDLMGGAPLETASLVRIDPDGSVAVVADDLWFPNGSVITDDGTLLVNETFGNRITAFDIAEDGSLDNRREWASFGELPDRSIEKALGQIAIAPDGCGLDAEGALWVADALNARLVRIREGGEIVDSIDTGSGVFACILGGSDGKTLFASVAPDFHEEARRNAREGSVVAVRVDVGHGGTP
ncbi:MULTISPECIES: SMP-30/gluconolactonase/LRE family protein [Pseudonocardia]|uniref:Virginiamycin B lyase n=2 Tax=Pseudonocardia TaxID=1847 RepID=A0A1Y2MQG7_PSEAH|nr:MULTISPECIES: SMP-30/gluconolactonase/LRE family protein [Pseudonocardia]OSY37401.1 Virginiamycin B lyase [Pseudonocardia autotrophica]TDN77274.1 sugar lactone lactonase YvrE [Pseudonocardia autotrophica]BBG01293.1 gluconolactonase [Pseudonocardia autotrophica]GEC26020.1 gluconolaconase [Pseudonocardia saturnea]